MPLLNLPRTLKMIPYSEENFNFSFPLSLCVFFLYEVHCLGPFKIMSSTFHSSISLRTSFQTIAFQAFYFIRVFITLSFTMKHVVIWTIFFPVYWFQVWLFHDKDSFMFNILYYSLNFATIIHLVNGTSFSNFTRPQTWQLVLFFIHKVYFQGITFYSSKDWIVLAGVLSWL